MLLLDPMFFFKWSLPRSEAMQDPEMIGTMRLAHQLPAGTRALTHVSMRGIGIIAGLSGMFEGLSDVEQYNFGGRRHRA